METVIVNGIKTNLKPQTCTRCVQDNSVPGIEFDTKGVCNFCHQHDFLEKEFPNDEKGEAILQKIFHKIKLIGKKNKYDCVIGVSGGRDSTYLIYLAVKKWGLRPLAVHFNDGFDNPVAGENMVKSCKKLGIDLRTITSDWREGKDLKIDFLKASVPDINLGTDIGIASSLYGVAAKENIKYILIGQSFRTEGVKPLSWSYFDGDYLRHVHQKFGTVKLRPWKATDPGFNLGIRELFYYTAIRGIKTITPMYYFPYIRKEAEKIIIDELGWVYPGAHYFDDLYHSLIKYVHRVKFNIDLNMNSDSALVRSGQMDRIAALERAHGIYTIEDPRIIDLCIKRLGLSREEFDSFMNLSPKTFKNYKTSYNIIRLFRLPILVLSYFNLLPKVTYYKYFKCGK
ncbi:MAG: N-acetyl sugar amidotransferase [Bacteroidales bacterium]|nr:N-acetyl sugar amidotransferase [Bacteroidales bacterium]